MSKQTRFVANSIAAIIAGFAAFFAAGGIAFGAMYVFFFYLWPKPTSWMGLVNNVNLELCSLVGAALGSIVGGYVTARVAKRNQFIHAAVVIAMLSALDQVYILWGTDTQWTLPFDRLLPTILGYVPFFVFGTWIGSRKRKQIERSE
jgi:hypothetical protein